MRSSSGDRRSVAGWRDGRVARAARRLIGRSGRRVAAALHGDAGMSTAEYAIGCVAAAAFAALLYTVLTGDAVTDALDALVRRALSVDF